MNKFAEKILWNRTQRYIQKYHPNIIGIAGSVNKTITKQAIALALKDAYRVRADHASFTSPIGVALAALGIRSMRNRFGWVRLLAASKAKEITEEEPDTIILELGADKPGDIDALVQHIPFNIGVVTRVDAKNLHLFGNKEMIAHEMTSLPVSLKDTAVLNIDDPLVQKMTQHIQAPIITYGESKDADIQLVRAERIDKSGFLIEIKIDNRSYECNLTNIIARHQLHAVLAALGVLKALGQKELKNAIQNLHKLKPPKGCMQMRNGINDSLIIDDTWDATPESTIAAIKTLAAMPARRRIAILSDIQNLSAQAIQAHTEIGEMLAQHVDIFIAVGQDMKHAQAAALANEHEVDTHHFPTSKDVGKWLPDYIRPNDLLLIKGSRNMKMEQAVERLLAK